MESIFWKNLSPLFFVTPFLITLFLSPPISFRMNPPSFARAKDFVRPDGGLGPGPRGHRLRAGGGAAAGRGAQLRVARAPVVGAASLPRGLGGLGGGVCLSFWRGEGRFGGFQGKHRLFLDGASTPRGTTIVFFVETPH